MQKRLLGSLFALAVLASAPAFAAPVAPGSFQVANAGSEALISKAKAQRSAGHYRAAEATLEQAVSKDPDDYDAVMALGRLQDYMGSYEEAYASFKKAATIRADDFGAQVMMAHSDVMSEHYDRAKNLCEKLEHDPAMKDASARLRSEIHVSLGGALGLKAKREGIWAMLRYGMSVRKEEEKALDIDSDNPRARYGLGRYFYEAPGAVGGNQGKGLEMLAKATKMDPSDWVIRGMYVRDLFHSNRPEAKEEAARYAHDFAEIPGAKRDYGDVFSKAN